MLDQTQHFLDLGNATIASLVSLQLVTLPPIIILAARFQHFQSHLTAMAKGFLTKCTEYLL
jgi:hypothetical protein